MPELVVFVLVVGIVAVVGLRFGMLLAPRVDRLTAGEDAAGGQIDEERTQ